LDSAELESDEFDASEQTAIKFDLNTWLVGWLVGWLAGGSPFPHLPGYWFVKPQLSGRLAQGLEGKPAKQATLISGRHAELHQFNQCCS
jgi:hypothetical protein